MTAARLSLGPLLYYWPRQQTFDFYDDIAQTEIDIVYLGESVCSRRHELDNNDWLTIGAKLQAPIFLIKTVKAFCVPLSVARSKKWCKQGLSLSLSMLKALMPTHKPC